MSVYFFESLSLSALSLPILFSLSLFLFLSLSGFLSFFASPCITVCIVVLRTTVNLDPFPSPSNRRVPMRLRHSLLRKSLSFLSLSLSLSLLSS